MEEKEELLDEKEEDTLVWASLTFRGALVLLNFDRLVKGECSLAWELNSIIVFSGFVFLYDDVFNNYN